MYLPLPLTRRFRSPSDADITRAQFVSRCAPLLSTSSQLRALRIAGPYYLAFKPGGARVPFGWLYAAVLLRYPPSDRNIISRSVLGPFPLALAVGAGVCALSGAPLGDTIFFVMGLCMFLFAVVIPTWRETHTQISLELLELNCEQA